MKISLRVIKNYVKDSDAWWRYWIVKLVARYCAGRAVVSQIAVLLSEKAALDYSNDKHKLRSRLEKKCALYDTCIYHDELSVIPHSDQVLLEKLYGAGIERDYIKLADHSMHSLAEFKKAIVQGALMHHYFRNMRRLAEDLPLSYHYVKTLSAGLEKRTVYLALRDRDDLPRGEAKKIAGVVRTEDERAYAKVMKGKGGGHVVVVPVGVHAKRRAGYRHYYGRGFENTNPGGIRFDKQGEVFTTRHNPKIEGDL